MRKIDEYKITDVLTPELIQENEIENLDELFVPVELDETESEHLAAEPYSYWKSVFKVFIHKQRNNYYCKHK